MKPAHAILAVLTMILLFIGGGVWLWHLRVAGPVREHRERMNEKEDAELAERINITEAMRQRTRWNRLDETGTNHRCNQDSLSMPQNESPCTSDPLNRNLLYVGANDYRNGNGWQWAGFYRSWDGGDTGATR